MRHVGSCSNCKKRKEKCDPGTPCKSCIEHFGSDLVNHPCRDRLISGLASVFLAERHGWHPTTKAIEAYSGTYQTSSQTYSIPIIFGFGSTLHVPVSLISFADDSANLFHQHTIYSWPPDSFSSQTHHHAVLPAILTPDAMKTLPSLLDTHLSLLVNHHFRAFPPFRSPLRILRHVYVYYTSLAPSTPASQLLHQALKLLVLVHVGGDMTVPDPSTSPELAQLIAETGCLPQGVTPTPCLIRSQFGSAMPTLALKLMREILLSLEHLLLRRAIPEWPVALATLIVLLMTLESIQYHSAKLPYHHHQFSSPSSSPADDTDAAPASLAPEHALAADDDGVRQLLEFYGACFPGCHARVHPAWKGDPEEGVKVVGEKRVGMASEDRFVENIRGAVREASRGYLEGKAGGEREGEGEGEGMGFYFDRLVARLLVWGRA